MMKAIMKVAKILMVMTAVGCLAWPWPALAEAVTSNVDVSAPTLERIEKFVNERLDHAHIPGASLVIVKGDQTIYNQGFGYADKQSGQPVQPDTLFEMGSNTKSFTAIALMQLRDQGRISFEDPVQTYIPWLKTVYKGQEVPVTISQLLHHTSGIDLDTQLGDIAEHASLEDTVRFVAQHELKYMPGDRWRYCTLNYDIIGYLIEQLSGQTYESYMKEHVLAPLGLTHTYINRNEALQTGKMATGYRTGFKQSWAFTGPVYDGNIPAAYMISSINDMAQWVKIQMGLVPTITPDMQRHIHETHVPDRTVAPLYNTANYGMGWEYFQSGGGQIEGQGLNPAFSSFFMFRPQEKLGIALLTNMGSEEVVTIGEGIMNMIRGKKVTTTDDFFTKADNTATLSIVLSALFCVTCLGMIGMAIAETIRGQRKRAAFTGKGWASFVISLIFMGVFTLCAAKVNLVFYQSYSWATLKVYGPSSLMPAAIIVFATGLLFYLYMLFTEIFPKKEGQLFSLISLSLVSGLGNAIVIFMIMEALSRISGQNYFFTNGTQLIIYFVLGLAMYAYGQKVIRTRLIAITNQTVFEKRMQFLHKILRLPYQRFEALDSGNIHAYLNNDTEMVSRFSNAVVTVLTGLVTVVACFVYLGFVSLSGLLVSIAVVAIGVGLYYGIGVLANRLWEETRDIQNLFFRFIHDFVTGFKELYLHRRKSADFTQDMEATCIEYRDKRGKADLMFANVFVVGELLFTVVIGVVVFAFPIIYKNGDLGNISSFVFVFLYMMGPISIIVSTIPELLQVKVSWNRIKLIMAEVETEPEAGTVASNALMSGQASVQLRGVTYTYRNAEGRLFQVGPISYQFRAGEIIFITGGNGSGKSTLAKLITGLYAADAGEIAVNGVPVQAAELGQHFSAIFSDVYVFEKLYGIDVENKRAEIENYLNILQLTEKVFVENGRFNTTKLSTGQKKRLALLISYLEDRPICLFDEWAADQDPEYRHFFYEVLLKEMRANGKCVIAITHDDRYFNVADRVIKMELGQMVSAEQEHGHEHERENHKLTASMPSV